METLETSVVMAIVRKDGILSSVSGVMPTWQSINEDGEFVAKIPFLGMEALGSDEQDLHDSIIDCITAFCIIAEKHGEGLEKELSLLGWELVESEGEVTTLDASGSFAENETLSAILSTGEVGSFKLDLNEYLMAA